MGILDDARFLQYRKRTDRLLIPKQKKIKGATYLGKDPVDGTDIIEVDGDEPVSGFRLVSNKPISTGDRVSLRPSESGLQRADARNVAPKVDGVPVEVENTIFFNVRNQLGFCEIFVENLQVPTISGYETFEIFGGNALDISFLKNKKINKAQIKIAEDSSPVTNTFNFDSNTLGSVEFSELYYKTKVTIPCASDYSVRFPFGFFISTVKTKRGIFIESRLGFPQETSFDVEAYASINDAAFSLISSFTHVFPSSADTSNPSNFFSQAPFPDPFESGNGGQSACSVAGESTIEVYIQWKKTGNAQWFSI